MPLHGQCVRAADTASIEHHFPSCVTRARAVVAGTELLLEGETPGHSLWLVGGWAAIYKQMDDGRRQIIDVHFPFDMIIPPHLHGQQSPFGVMTLTDAKVAFIPFGWIDELRHDNSDFFDALDVLERNAAARRAERMLRLGQGSAEEIVAYLLLELCVRLSAQGHSQICEFAIPISQKAMGEIVGLTNVHVCRMLGRLVRAGMIESDGHQVTIRSPERLADFCGIDLACFRKQIAAKAHDAPT